MSKSVYAIGGIGLASCVILSLMMQHLLKVKAERQRSPVATELEELFKSQLAGPVTDQVIDRDGRRTLVVRMVLLAGLQKQRIGASAGGLIWRRVLSGSGEPPEVVLLELADDGGGRTEEFVAPRPPMLGGVPAGAEANRPPPTGQPAAPGNR